jgi:hypothetical protein
MKKIEKIVGFSTNHPVVDVETYNNLEDYGIRPWPYHKGEIGIAGFFVDDKITQFLLIHKENIEIFRKAVHDILSTLSGKLLHAFNTEMETGSFKKFLGYSPQFHEIKPFNGKGTTKEYFFAYLLRTGRVAPDFVKFEDPLNGDSFKCIECLNNGRFEDALGHNICCLTKEALILEHNDFIIEQFKHLLNKDMWLRDGKSLPLIKG